MSINRRSFNQLMLLASASTLLPSISFGQGAAPATGGTLNWLYRVDPGNALFAINTSSGTGQAIGPKIVEGLLTFDLDVRPQPLLATEWAVSDDNLRYTFKLRKGVKWHDGKDFTSDDVAFSIFRLKEAHPRGRITYQNVVAVETPDPLTAIIVLSKPAPFLLAAQSSSESPIVPKHIFEKLAPGDGQTLQTAIGTGPFKLTEWVAGSHLIFERNPDYWDAGKPYLDRIILRIVTDPAARSAALETGEADIGDNPVPLADLDRLKQVPNLIVDTTTYAYSGPQQQLFFNYDNPLFAKREVRLAIAQAINLQEIVDVALYGYAQVSPSPVSTALPQWYDKSVVAHPYDTAAAEKLLDEAGYPRKADGKRFDLRLTYNSYLPQGYADVLKSQLEKIGVGIEIKKYDLPTFLKTVYTDRAFDLVVESLSTLSIRRSASSAPTGARTSRSGCRSRMPATTRMQRRMRCSRRPRSSPTRRSAGRSGASSSTSSTTKSPLSTSSPPAPRSSPTSGSRTTSPDRRASTGASAICGWIRTLDIEEQETCLNI